MCWSSVNPKTPPKTCPVMTCVILNQNSEPGDAVADIAVERRIPISYKFVHFGVNSKTIGVEISTCCESGDAAAECYAGPSHSMSGSTDIDT